MKKIFLLAISLPFLVCAGFTDSVQHAGERTVATARSLVTPDHENYWLNNIRTFKTYPIVYYQQHAYSKPVEVENNVRHAREYPLNVVISANVGQVMVSDEVYTVSTENLGEHYEIAGDGIVYNSDSEIKLVKGQVITPIGEVKIDGQYYIVFEPERDGRMLLADEQGQILHNIGRYYRGEFLLSRDLASVLPKDLSIIKTSDVKHEISNSEMQFEIKYDGIADGLIKFVYVDYSNGRRETQLAFSSDQRYLDINGKHIQVITATADNIEYILFN